MSGEVEASQAELDLKALESFLVGNQDLERLEALLDRFNILETLGVVRQELRHSDFLAYLLDPRGNHGMGDAFVKRLLQRVLTVAGNTTVSLTPDEFEGWTLNRMTMQREWQYLDILLLDEEHELAVIVENKIGTEEHSDQLQRYYDLVRQHYPGWRIVGLYLTPGGERPSHEAYLPVSYGFVCEAIDDLAESRTSVLDPDVKTLMTHYTEMLRRNIIVGDSEIGRLCRQINRRHRRALDLIYEYRAKAQPEIQSLIKGLVNDEPRLIRDYSSKSEVYFGVRDWDTPALITNSGGVPPGRMLLFDFWNYPGSLDLKLYVGPGPEETRQRLLDVARAHPDVFGVTGKPNSRLTEIFSRPFLNQEMYEDADPGDRDEEIHRRWRLFLEEDLPRIDAALKKEAWVWESNDDVDEAQARSGDRFVWGEGDIRITRRPDESQE